MTGAEASVQWWLIGWVVSFALLLGGYGIAELYYDTTSGDNRHPEGGDTSA